MNHSSPQPTKPASPVAILARRYWPSICDASLRLANLTKSLRWSGLKVCVGTPRWHSSWPKQVTVEEVPVSRLEHPPSNQLRQSHYRRSIATWLDQNARDYAWIYCDEPGLDALAVLRHPVVIHKKIPVVVRFDPLEISSSLPTPEPFQPSQSIIDSCAIADRVIVPHPSAQQILLRHGISPQRISVCSDWGVRAIDRTSADIRTARKALADINSDLNLRSHERLIVVPGELTPHWKLSSLIQSITPLLDRMNHVRLWLHGEGLERERLYEQLQFFGHHRTVIMPGVVTSIDTLLQAADLCLFPSSSVGLSWLVPSCLISGIPTLVARSSELNWHLGLLAAAIDFEAESSSSLLERIEHWTRSPEELTAACRSAGQLIRRQSLNTLNGHGLNELLRSIIPSNQKSQTTSMPNG